METSTINTDKHASNAMETLLRGKGAKTSLGTNFNGEMGQMCQDDLALQQTP